MLKNFFRTTWRTLLRQRTYSAINIAGLGIGLTASILIGLWVTDELSFDRFHTNSASIFRVVETQHYNNGADFHVAVTPGPLAPGLKTTFPEIQDIIRVAFNQGTMQYGDNQFREDDIAFTDPAFLTAFSFPLLKGDASSALANPNNIILTQHTAQKYFGARDPIGKTIKLKIFEEQNFTVTGVLAGIPTQSHLSFVNIILPYAFAEKNFPWLHSLNNNNLYTYVQLKKDVDYRSFDKKITKFLADHTDLNGSDLVLQPLTAIHLHSGFTADISGNSSIQYVYIFSVIGILVIIIAGINFMNLSTARYERRAKEVGVRKVIGAGRMTLIAGFLGESVFMSLIALGLAAILITLLLPAFNDLSGKKLALTSLTTLQISGTFAFTLLTGLASGIYPALFLSAFKPINTLKSIANTRIKGASFREILVVTQFVISVGLIIGTLTIGNQLKYIRERRLGYDKDNIVILPGSKDFDNFKSEILQQQGILGVTESNQLLTNVVGSSSNWEWQGKDPNASILFHRLSVGYDFLETFHIRMLQGRSFSKEYGTDSVSYIINEEAMRQMKLTNPIGKKLVLGKETTNGKIIGLVQDFNFKSVHNKIEPLIFLFRPQECWRNFVRVSPGHLADEMAAIERTWKRFNPHDAYEFSFLDEKFGRLYRTEQRTATIFQWFSALAIFISCLGLFGLVTYAAERRIREIGIRKVLGASGKSIIFLLSRQFLRLVLIALVIAIPLSAWAMNRWLQDFAYRITLQWWVFALGGILALVIAIATVSIQAARASLANPIKSLRAE